MKKYYTTDEMIEFLGAGWLEHEDVEEIVEEIRIRLSSQSQHINWMRGRLELAERVIGELYLMQREVEE